MIMNLKISKSTLLGILFIFIALAFGVHASLTSYMDGQGILHESLSTPLSAIFGLLGLVIIITSLITKQIKIKSMNKQFYKDAFVWGVALWLIGYILGILLFLIVPANILGWMIMPIGMAITIWVLLKKIKKESFSNYILLAIVWTLIAIIFDYIFLVKVFKPIGYYKFDVYLYYFLTFALPIIIGFRKKVLLK